MKRRIKWMINLLLGFALFTGLSGGALAAEQPVRGKLVALTFDDGPNINVTPTLLDELAERNVKCTFFVVGYCAQAYPELVLRAYEQGHQIASHTYNHPALTGKSDYVIQQEIEGTRALLESITGEKNFMLRLPYGDGATSSRVLGYANAPVIMWSVDPTNGRYPNTEEQLYRGILKQVHDGAIILLHDTSSVNVRAAMRAIETLQSEGYSFVTLDELFRLKGVSPQNGTVYSRVDAPAGGYDESRLREHWAHPAIESLKARGIMVGDSGGFRPEDYMTRAMAVTLLWRASGEPSGTEVSLFGDVPLDEWYADAVSWGHQTGIVLGVDEDHFMPLELITREQLCTLIIRLAAKQGAALPDGVAAARIYGDVKRISPWARSSVERIWSAGFVSANDASIFRPGDSVTRAEAAELIHWYLQYAPEKPAEPLVEQSSSITTAPLYVVMADSLHLISMPKKSSDDKPL